MFQACRRGARGEAQGGRREGSSAHTPSIADGTALHRGRVGSRHFEALDIVRYRVLFKMSEPVHVAAQYRREPMCTACIVPVKRLRRKDPRKLIIFGESGAYPSTYY